MKIIPLDAPKGKNGFGTVRYINIVVGGASNGANKSEQRARWRVLDALDKAVDEGQTELLLENGDWDNLKTYINQSQLTIICSDLVPIQDAIENAKDVPMVVA